MAIAALLCLFVVFPLALMLSVRYCKRPIAAFHRVCTNRITSMFAARLSGFAIIMNVGRRSGKRYRTPVNVFWRRDGLLIALTYGRNSGWVANVLAAGHCEVETRGVCYQLSSPVVVHDPSRQQFPPLVGAVLRVIDANDYLRLCPVADNGHS
jgi:deazaflavin-dependent oxidoreductase (nitroreductase family)